MPDVCVSLCELSDIVIFAWRSWVDKWHTWIPISLQEASNLSLNAAALALHSPSFFWQSWGEGVEEEHGGREGVNSDTEKQRLCNSQCYHGITTAPVASARYLFYAYNTALSTHFLSYCLPVVVGVLRRHCTTDKDHSLVPNTETLGARDEDLATTTCKDH